MFKAGEVVRLNAGTVVDEMDFGGKYGIVEGSLYSVPGHVLVGFSGAHVPVVGVVLVPEAAVSDANESV